MNTRIMTVGKNINRHKKEIPLIRLTGDWFSEAGFYTDVLVTVEYTSNNIIVTLQGEGMATYNRLVQSIRKNKMELKQVHHCYQNSTKKPGLEIRGVRLEKLGFFIGDILAIGYDYGVIHIKKIDFDKL